MSGGTFSTNNYNIAYVNGGLTVNRANLTVTGNSIVKTYGDLVTFSGTEFSASGLKNNETATTATLTSSGAAANAAYSSSPYAVMTSGLTGGTFSSNNYNISYSNGGLRVNKANATVMGLSGSTEFDGTTKTLTGFTATGLVNGETTGDIVKSASLLTGKTYKDSTGAINYQEAANDIEAIRGKAFADVIRKSTGQDTYLLDKYDFVPART